MKKLLMLVVGLGLAGSLAAVSGAEPAVMREAAFWLDAADAATLTFDAGGAVKTWRSKASGGALATAAGAPRVVQSTEGQTVVDFGPMASGKDLTYPRLTQIRTVFEVARFETFWLCHLLGDVNGGKGVHNFHRGFEGAYVSKEWGKFAAVWDGLEAVDDPEHDVMPGGVRLVVAEMRCPCASDSLTRDRDFADRSGGKQLCELVCFNRVLTAEERDAVSRHLIAKWRIRDDRSPERREWELLARDQANWKKLPARTNAEAFHPAACIYPTDRDPLSITLRRARALADDLAGEVDLSAELRELNSLAVKAEHENKAETRFELFVAVRALVRRIAFKNPLLKGIDRLLFAGHQPPGFHENRKGSHMCDQYYGFFGTQFGTTVGDGIYILEQPFSDHPVARNIIAGKPIVSGAWKGRTLDGCAVISPELNWEANRIAFAATRGKGQRYVWNDDTVYHVFSCALDGSDLRQLTEGPWNEFDPCWLPNGRLVFTSERRGGYVRCSGDRKVPTFTLHTMFEDGTDIVRLSPHETNEWHPSVNNDGMVVYTRWDYVDRGHTQAEAAWTTFPDGRDPRELNGNTRLHFRTSPCVEMNVRQIPGSGRYVATAAPHHGWSAGALIIIDPSVPDDGEMSSIRRLTPEQPMPESEFYSKSKASGAYANAWPLSEKYYICSYEGYANGLYPVSEKRRYSIALIDAFGNKIKLYTHPTISCIDPMPIRARKRPPVLRHQTLEGLPADADGKRPTPPKNLPKTAEIGLVNVYDTRIPFPSNTVITALRVWQVFPRTMPVLNHPSLGAEPHQTGRQCLGTVPVEADGSAYFTAPVGVPLFFQALRADGCAVQNMRSDTYVHPGERLFCSGCHEPKENVRRTARKTLPQAMRRAPSAIQAGPDGTAPFNYVRLVQPVLDAKCVSCHGEKRAPKAPDLRLGDWRKNRLGYATSWMNLVNRTAYFGLNWRNFAFMEPAYTAPGEWLAIAAPLRKMLDAGHHGVKLTPEERERLVIWMDSNGQYLGHCDDIEKQRDGKCVPPVMQ